MIGLCVLIKLFFTLFPVCSELIYFNITLYGGSLFKFDLLAFHQSLSIVLEMQCPHGILYHQSVTA